MGQPSTKIEALRELLLDDDRQQRGDLAAQLAAIQTIVDSREQLEPRLNPILEDRFEQFAQSIPKTLGPAITEALKREISNSRDQVVDALYPIIGKMIKKYLAHEMETLKHHVNEGLRRVFSWKGLKMKVKSWFTDQTMADLILYDVNGPQLEEMMVIENESGLLKGSYSKNETLDQDMIAGMLTAIKSFVEDAFNKGTQDLEHVQYESYNIHLYNFASFYIAVVVSGTADAVFKAKLRDTVMAFSEKYLTVESEEINAENYIHSRLKTHFS